MSVTPMLVSSVTATSLGGALRRDSAARAGSASGVASYLLRDRWMTLRSVTIQVKADGLCRCLDYAGWSGRDAPFIRRLRLRAQG